MNTEQSYRIYSAALLKDLKKKMRENALDMKALARRGDYTAAAQLESVNGCLDYVINRLKCIIKNSKK